MLEDKDKFEFSQAYTESDLFVIERVEQACVTALASAMKEDGAVVKIGCDSPSEIWIASEFLKHFLGAADANAEIQLLEEKSNRVRFEFSNNSAILLGRK